MTEPRVWRSVHSQCGLPSARHCQAKALPPQTPTRQHRLEVLAPLRLVRDEVEHMHIP